MTGTPWLTRRRRESSLLAVVLVYVFLLLRKNGPAGGLHQGMMALVAQPEATIKTGGAPKPTLGSVEGVVVLGMHRSGTSMLTGLLQGMGLHLGEPDDLLRAKEAVNAKGFYERTQVFMINERLMREQSLEWYSDVYKFDHSIAAVRRLESDEHGGLRVANVFVCVHPSILLV